MDEAASLYNKALLEMNYEEPKIALVLKYLNRASELGSHHAAWALGAWYLRGNHLKRDVTKAVKLLEFASEANIPDAMYDLAICLEKGDGTPKNETRAYKLYLESALRGFKGAIVEVGRCYYWGIGVPEDKATGEIWFEYSKEIGMFRVDECGIEVLPRRAASLNLVVDNRAHKVPPDKD